MRPAWLLASVFALGCAPTPAGPRAPTASTRIATVPEVETDAAPAPKSRVWGLLDREGPLFGYVDVQRLLASPLGRGILAALPQMQSQGAFAADPLAELTRSCGFDPTKAVRELTFGAHSVDDELTVVIALDVRPDQALGCIEQYKMFEPVTLAGRTALCEPWFSTFPSEDSDDEPPANYRTCLAPHGSLLVMASFSRLEPLLANFPAPSGAPPPREYFQIAGEFLEPFGAERATFTLAEAGPSLTRLRLEALTGTPEEAEKLETLCRKVLAAVPGRAAGFDAQEPRALLAPYLEKLELGHERNSAHATLTVEDTLLTETLSSLATLGVKRYVAETKLDPARVEVTLIATRLAVYANGQASHRFPRSAPLTPSRIPSGVEYTSTPDDWAHPSWSIIGFEREGPQYHSYEYETSKDGKRATVRARGDLDGDGVPSLIEMDVVLEGNEARIVPGLREIDPHE